MQPQDIHFTDWLRILIGEVPASFYIELLIRAFAVYLILMVSMRTMGKRMSSQLSRNELAALVSLAAAVGIPMMAPDRGLLEAVVIAFVLISIERMIAKRSFNNEQFESYALDKISALINDGIVDMKELKRAGLSHERVFAQLRTQGVMQLGAVSRLYMEASGSFTLVQNPKPIPGLCVLPPWDDPMKDYFYEHPEQKLCVQCGFPQQRATDKSGSCPNCGQKKWVNAVEEISNDYMIMMKRTLIALILLALAGCQTPDEEIHADIATKAKQDLNFSGLNYTVQTGVVNFSGNCPSEKALLKIKQTISNIHVIKAVNYRVTITPVMLDTLTPVKLQADSLLAQYPRVTAEVRPDAITLKGEITASKKAKLIKAFNMQRIGIIKDSLTVY